MTFLAWAVAAVLAGLALLHIGWAFGFLRPAAAAIPERNGTPVFTPGRASTLAVAALLLAAALIVLLRADAFRLGSVATVVHLGAWVVATVFLVRAIGDFRYVGFFKSVRGTRFAALDTRVYSPLCLVLGLAMAVLALRGR